MGSGDYCKSQLPLHQHVAEVLATIPAPTQGNLSPPPMPHPAQPRPPTPTCSQRPYWGEESQETIFRNAKVDTTYIGQGGRTFTIQAPTQSECIPGQPYTHLTEYLIWQEDFLGPPEPVTGPFWAPPEGLYSEEVERAQHNMTDTSLTIRAMATMAVMNQAVHALQEDPSARNFALQGFAMLRAWRDTIIAFQSPFCDYGSEDIRTYGNLLAESALELFHTNNMWKFEANYGSQPGTSHAPVPSAVCPPHTKLEAGNTWVNRFHYIKKRLTPRPFGQGREHLPAHLLFSPRSSPNTFHEMANSPKPAPAEASTQPNQVRATTAPGDTLRVPTVGTSATTTDGLYGVATSNDAIMSDGNAGGTNAKYGGDKAITEGICSSMHAPKPPPSGSVPRKASVPARQAKQQMEVSIEVDMGEIPGPAPIVPDVSLLSADARAIMAVLQLLKKDVEGLATRVLAVESSKQTPRTTATAPKTSSPPARPSSPPAPTPLSNWSPSPGPDPAPAPAPARQHNPARVDDASPWKTVPPKAAKSKPDSWAGKAQAGHKANPSQPKPVNPSLAKPANANLGPGKKESLESKYIFDFKGDPPTIYINKAASIADMTKWAWNTIQTKALAGNRVTVLAVGYTNSGNVKVTFAKPVSGSNVAAIQNVAPILRSALTIGDNVPLIPNVTWGHVVIMKAPAPPSSFRSESSEDILHDLLESNPGINRILKVRKGPTRSKNGKDVTLQFDDPNGYVAPLMVQKGVRLYRGFCKVRMFVEHQVLKSCTCCHKDGHFKGQCPSKIVSCGVCLLNHPTGRHDKMCKKCTDKGRTTKDKCPHMKCANCGSMKHKSSDLSCPAKTHKVFPDSIGVYGGTPDQMTRGKSVRAVLEERERNRAINEAAKRGGSVVASPSPSLTGSEKAHREAVKEGKKKAVTFSKPPRGEEGYSANLDWHMSEEQVEEDAVAWADMAMESAPSEVNTSGWS